MNYPYDGIVFVPAAMAGDARAWFAANNPDTNAVAGDALTVPLASALLPSVITHYGSKAALTQAFVDAMSSARTEGTINTIGTWTYTYYMVRVSDGILLATNSVGATGSLGGAFGWDDALADAGLVRYTE